MQKVFSHLLLEDYFKFVEICKGNTTYFTECEFKYKIDKAKGYIKRDNTQLIEYGNALVNSNLYFRFRLSNDVYSIFHIEEFNEKNLKFKIKKHTYIRYFWNIFGGHMYETDYMLFGTLNLFFVKNEYKILTKDTIK